MCHKYYKDSHNFISISCVIIQYDNPANHWHLCIIYTSVNRDVRTWIHTMLYYFIWVNYFVSNITLFSILIHFMFLPNNLFHCFWNIRLLIFQCSQFLIFQSILIDINTVCIKIFNTYFYFPFFFHNYHIFNFQKYCIPHKILFFQSSNFP